MLLILKYVNFINSNCQYKANTSWFYMSSHIILTGGLNIIQILKLKISYVLVYKELKILKKGLGDSVSSG